MPTRGSSAHNLSCGVAKVAFNCHRDEKRVRPSLSVSSAFFFLRVESCLNSRKNRFSTTKVTLYHCYLSYESHIVPLIYTYIRKLYKLCTYYDFSSTTYVRKKKSKCPLNRDSNPREHLHLALSPVQHSTKRRSFCVPVLLLYAGTVYSEYHIA